MQPNRGSSMDAFQTRHQSNSENNTRGDNENHRSASRELGRADRQPSDGANGVATSMEWSGLHQSVPIVSRTRLALMLVGATILGMLLASTVVGQTVSTVSPVVDRSNYIISSSPLPNGGSVQSTYYAPRYPSGSQNGYQSTQVVASQPTQNPAQTSPAVYQSNVVSYQTSGSGVTNQSSMQTSQMPTNSQSSVAYSAFSQDEQVRLQNTGWQVATATTLNNQRVGDSSSNTFSASPTYQAQRVSYQAGTNNSTQEPYYDAASAPPTLQGGQNGITNSTINSQIPNSLNWQPQGQVVQGGTYPVHGTYLANQACNPYATCSPYMTNRYAYSTQGLAQYPSYTSYRPILPLRRMPSQAYLGQGLYGQPKAYVHGESVRNFFRYILP